MSLLWFLDKFRKLFECSYFPLWTSITLLVPLDKFLLKMAIKGKTSFFKKTEWKLRFAFWNFQLPSVKLAWEIVRFVTDLQSKFLKTVYSWDSLCNVSTKIMLRAFEINLFLRVFDKTLELPWTIETKYNHVTFNNHYWTLTH